MARQVSYKTIKVYLAGIHLEHLERGFEDLTKDELLHLLCTGIKRSQGISTRTHLPITISVLQTLKSRLRVNSSFSPLEKRLLWAAFTMAFYGFLRASEFATPSLTWQHVQLVSNKYTIFIEQSKTDPFRCGHTITIHASGTSTALQLYVEAVLRQQLTNAICHLLQDTSYSQQNYSSHGFRSGAATTAAAAGIPGDGAAMLTNCTYTPLQRCYNQYQHSSPMPTFPVGIKQPLKVNLSSS